MRDLRTGGKSIVFISHKLKEVQAIADTITVLRRGTVVGQRPPGTSEEELASLMVGRTVQLQVTKKVASPGQVVLDVSNLTVAREHATPAAAYTAQPQTLGEAAEAAAQGQAELAVNDVSFQVRAGEILGIAGVQGNGQTELCEALMGLRPAATGAV